MSLRSLLPESVERYVAETITVETPLQRRLRAETSTLSGAQMQIGADQGAFMAMLVKLIGARDCLEIGTYTGYSALAIAAALPDDGRLICCDVSEEWTAVARRYWEDAGVAHKVTLRLQRAGKTLDELLADGLAGQFDFAFIDADKSGYESYYERCLKLLRSGGLIALDNMLWSGEVAQPKTGDADTEALKALNVKIRDDSRVDAALLTVGDGLMLARKR